MSAEQQDRFARDKDRLPFDELPDEEAGRIHAEVVRAGVTVDFDHFKRMLRQPIEVRLAAVERLGQVGLQKGKGEAAVKELERLARHLEKAEARGSRACSKCRDTVRMRGTAR